MIAGGLRDPGYQYAIIKDLGLLRSTYIVITPLGGVVGCGCVPEATTGPAAPAAVLTVEPAGCHWAGNYWLVDVPPAALVASVSRWTLLPQKLPPAARL